MFKKRGYHDQSDTTKDHETKDPLFLHVTLTFFVGRAFSDAGENDTDTRWAHLSSA